MTKLVIVIAKSNKSWGVGLDFAYSNADNYSEITIVDFASTQNIFPRSQRRKKMETLIAKRSNIRFLRIRRISKDSFSTCFLIIKMLPTVMLAQAFRYKHLDGMNPFVFQAVEARLSQTMGTMFYDMKYVPRFQRLRFLFRAIISDRVASQHLCSSENEELVVFNGREPIESVWIRKYLDSGRKVQILERASSDQKFELYKVSPHFHPEWWEKISEFASNSPSWTVDDFSVDERYLQNKIKGYDSFTGKKWSKIQNKKSNLAKLPREYVLYFSTSSHEYSPINEFNCRDGYENQFKAVEDLILACEELNCHLIIRRHPNSVSPHDGKDYEAKLWEKYASTNVQIVSPESIADSILLARQAKVCFVWRSSIAVETIALGKSTYVLGSAKYAWKTNSASRAWNIQAIKKAIQMPSLNERDEFEKYIAYMARGGSNLSLFRSINSSFVIDSQGRRIYPTMFGWLFSNLRFRSHKLLGITKRKA
jgi:hypothetical protein